MLPQNIMGKKLNTLILILCFLIGLFVGIHSKKYQESNQIDYKSVVETYIHLDSAKYQHDDISHERILIETIQVVYGEYIVETMQEYNFERVISQPSGKYDLLVKLQEELSKIDVHLNLYIPK